MNNITIAGQLGLDSEIRYLANGDAVCSFSVADSMGKDKPTIWWSCSLFGKRAEALGQYLMKGQAVTVAGNVRQRDYTDKDGNKRTSMDVRVTDVALQGGKREPQSHEYQRPEEMRKEPTRTAPARAAAPAPDFDDGSDIPFITASAIYDMTTSKARKMARYDY